MDFEAINTYNGLMKANYFENDVFAPPPRLTTSKLKPKIFPTFKQNMLHRRMDDDGVVRCCQIKIAKRKVNYTFFQHQPECGIPRTAQNTIQKRIIGGRTAQFAEMPWQAHIRIGEYQCGGVLGNSFVNI